MCPSGSGGPMRAWGSRAALGPTKPPRTARCPQGGYSVSEGAVGSSWAAVSVVRTGQGALAALPSAPVPAAGTHPGPSPCSPNWGAALHQGGAEPDQGPGGQPAGESGAHGPAEAPGCRSDPAWFLKIGGGVCLEPCLVFQALLGWSSPHSLWLFLWLQGCPITLTHSATFWRQNTAQAM